MNSFGIPFARFAFAVLVVAMASVLFSNQTSADGPGPGTIETLIVDTDVTANHPNTIATIEPCRAASIGNFFDVDIVADEIPSFAGILGGGTAGIGFDLLYDPGVLRITARDAGDSLLFYQDQPKGLYYDAFSDSLPDTDGDYRHDALEIAGIDTEAGRGVMVRLTIEIVGAGISSLILDDVVDTGDGTPDVLGSTVYINNLPLGSTDQLYHINSVVGGEIRSDGSSCPDQDYDGIQDSADNCPSVWNPSQASYVCDSVGGEVLITSHDASRRGLPLAPLATGGLLIALIGVGSYWRLRPH